MKFYEYETWLNEMYDYWIDYLNNQGSVNGEAQLQGYIDNLRNNILSYKNNSSIKIAFENCLLQLVAYIKVRRDLVFKNAPKVPELITDDDLRNWFNMFTYELNENYDQFYTYDNITDTLSTTTVYDNFIADVSNFPTQDISHIEAFKSAVPGAILKTMNYTALNQPKSFSMGIKPRSHINMSMYGQEVTDKFEWVIFGLNSDDPNA